MLIGVPRRALRAEHRRDQQVLERAHRGIGLRDLVGPPDAAAAALVRRFALEPRASEG